MPLLYPKKSLFSTCLNPFFLMNLQLDELDELDKLI